MTAWPRMLTLHAKGFRNEMSRIRLSRWIVSAFAVAGLALPAPGLADHDAISDPAPRQTHEKLKPLPKLDKEAITVSGLSSGGFFAHQFHIAYSKLVRGAGIIAGGPYGCVENITNPYWPWFGLDRTTAAVIACTHLKGERYFGLRPSPPEAKDSVELIRSARRAGTIDDPKNLADARVWLFHGRRDEVVPARMARLLHEVYRALDLPDAAIRDEAGPASHGLPVAAFPQESRFPKRDCDEHAPPYLIECGFDAAERLLRHLYGPTFVSKPADAHASGALVAFDQTEFSDASATRTSLSGVGYAYVPKQCVAGACRLHVAFHGCRQHVDNRDDDRAHDDFIRDAGYNRWAAANDTVVLYPQLTTSAQNPNACWDFWGYSGLDYYNQKGAQMRAVKAMVGRILRQPD
jgi:poly(3-hydroxybutyrate) depolymerase